MSFIFCSVQHNGSKSIFMTLTVDNAKSDHPMIFEKNKQSRNIKSTQPTRCLTSLPWNVFAWNLGAPVAGWNQ